MTLVNLNDTPAAMAKKVSERGAPPIVAQRMKQAREALGISQDELAVRAGMSQTGIGSIEAGEVARPRKLLELAQTLGKTPEWLLGKEERIMPRPAIAPAVLTARRIGGEGVLPVRGEVAAGVWRELEATDESPFEPLHVAPNPAYPADAQYGLVVRGTSIDKQARDGDIVVCLDLAMTGIEPNHNDLVVFERRRQQEGIREVTVKRLRRVGRSIELWPESDDPRFQEPIRLRNGGEDDTDGRVIAVVDWIYRPMRRPTR